MINALEQSQAYTVAPAPHASAAQQLAFTPGSETESPEEFSFFGEDGADFYDLIDVINPLQHLPIVSTMYREATGDDIAAAPRVAGATLFFGPLGLVASLANVAIENTTGKDVGKHIADWIIPNDDTTNEDGTAIADLNGAATPENSASWRNDGTDPLATSVDAVSAWARAEKSWYAQQDRSKASAPADRSGTPSPVPDAAPLLSEPDRFAAYRNTDIVQLTEDARSAAWAYEAAAGLRA